MSLSQEAVRNALTPAIGDGRYLRLDCSNDPLTDTLQGKNFTTFVDSDLIVNGTFATSASWTFGGDWAWNALEYAYTLSALSAK